MSNTITQTQERMGKQFSATRVSYLGTSATSTSLELFNLASVGIAAAALDASGQVPKLVAVRTVEPVRVSCAASRVPGTLPQMAGLPGKTTLQESCNISQCYSIDTMNRFAGTQSQLLALCCMEDVAHRPGRLTMPGGVVQPAEQRKTAA